MRRPVMLMLVMTLVACASPRGSEEPRGTTSQSPRASTTPTGTAGVPASRAERYVAIGASDTVGVGALDPRTGSWPARLAARLSAGSEYTNLGVSGSLAAQALREQGPPSVSRDPTVVTIWLAVNDLNAGVDPAEYRRTLDSLLDLLVPRTTAKVFVGNVPDLRAVPVYAQSDPALIAARVSAFNAAIAQSAERYGGRVVVVDLFTGSAEILASGVVAADGFHPSDEGYQLIADRFAAALRRAGIAVRS